MLDKILAPIVRWVLVVIAAGGYPGVVFLMAIESACVPLPSEVIMPFAGYLIAQGEMPFRIGGLVVQNEALNLFLAGLAGAIGCGLGSAVAYAIGAWGGRPFVEKYGRYILLRRRDVDKADRWFQKYGDWAIFTSRLLPVVRTFISLPAGISRMPFGRFMVLSILGSIPWCWFLAWIGAILGRNADNFHQVYRRLREYFHGVDIVIVLILGAMFAFWLWHHLKPDEEVEEPNVPLNVG